MTNRKSHWNGTLSGPRDEDVLSLKILKATAAAVHPTDILHEYPVAALYIRTYQSALHIQAIILTSSPRFLTQQWQLQSDSETVASQCQAAASAASDNVSF